MQLRRLPLALALAAGFVLVQVPLHEYAHCVSYWARGGGTCDVRFVAPGHPLPPSEGGLGIAAGALGEAFVGDAPEWEHPVMYAGHALGTLAFGLWLGGWLAGRRAR